MTCRGVHPRGGQSGDAAGERPHGGSVDPQAPEDGILRVQELPALHPVTFAIKLCQDSDPAQNHRILPAGSRWWSADGSICGMLWIRHVSEHSECGIACTSCFVLQLPRGICTSFRSLFSDKPALTDLCKSFFLFLPPLSRMYCNPTKNIFCKLKKVLYFLQKCDTVSMQK